MNFLNKEDYLLLNSFIKAYAYFFNILIVEELLKKEKILIQKAIK